MSQQIHKRVNLTPTWCDRQQQRLFSSDLHSSGGLLLAACCLVAGACCLVQPARNPACQFPWIIHLLNFLQCRDQVLVPLQQKREADYNLFCVESSFILVDNHVMTFWHLHRWWGAAWWWRPSPPPPWRRPATRPVSGDVSSGTQTCLWPKYPQCLFRSEHLMLETQIVMLTMMMMFISENMWSEKMAQKSGQVMWCPNITVFVVMTSQ